MEERQEQSNCTLCGDALTTDQTKDVDVLCAGCTDAWQREVDSRW